MKKIKTLWEWFNRWLVEHPDRSYFLDEEMFDNPKNDYLKELDLVVSTEKINDILPNTNGTIVFDYGNNHTFLVEFFDEDKTLSVESVTKFQIKKRP